MQLNQAQLESLLGKLRLSPDKKDLYGICPKCGKDEFGISLSKDHPFNCFRKKNCGFKGKIYTLLRFLNRLEEFVKDRPVGPLENIVESVSLELDLTLPESKPPIGWKRVYDDEYLRSRGFTDSDFKKYKVGRSLMMKDYVTILIEMRGVVTGYISRSVKSKSWIEQYNEQNPNNKHQRYRNSINDFSKMLMGYDEIVTDVTEDVILVEGPFSKITTDRNLGLDSYDYMKCCATFGAKISDEQIELLKIKNIKRVFLLHEADAIKQLKSTSAKLGPHFDEVKVGYLPDKDPDDLTSDELFEVLENTQSWIDIQINYIG